MNLKDLKLTDFVKIGIAVTATILITMNLQIQSHNTTTINNYIQETNKKLDTIEQTTTAKLDTISKTGNDTQGNLTKVKTDLSKNLAISKEILTQVD